MKITQIEKSKGTRYTIYVDDEYWYIIDLEIVLKNNLKVGMVVDEIFLEKMKNQAQQRKARERAYYLLGYRDHSKKELYDKLTKSVEPQIALETVELVEQQGLLDDEKYADKLARYYLHQKKWGQRRAIFEMYKKGINKELAQQAINNCDFDAVSQIVEIIGKKYYNCSEDYKVKQKTIVALLRLGYSYDDIKIAIENYNANN